MQLAANTYTSQKGTKATTPHLEIQMQVDQALYLKYLALVERYQNPTRKKKDHLIHTHFTGQEADFRQLILGPLIRQRLQRSPVKYPTAFDTTDLYSKQQVIPGINLDKKACKSVIHELLLLVAAITDTLQLYLQQTPGRFFSPSRCLGPNNQAFK